MTTIQQPTLAPPSQTTTTTIYNNPSTFNPPLKTSHLNGGDGLHDFYNYNQSQNETNQLHQGQIVTINITTKRIIDCFKLGGILTFR